MLYQIYLTYKKTNPENWLRNIYWANMSGEEISSRICSSFCVIQYNMANTIIGGLDSRVYLTSRINKCGEFFRGCRTVLIKLPQ